MSSVCLRKCYKQNKLAQNFIAAGNAKCFKTTLLGVPGDIKNKLPNS